VRAHAIRRQTLDLAVGSQALAFALQTRLGDFNRRRLLPVIEKVFNELDVPGQRIRIGRLEIDLGTVRFAAFEEEAERRLQVELRRALEKALRETGESSVSRSEAEARQELLERYLVHGTLPFWAPRRPAFSLEALVLEMAASDPEGLVEVVRRLGRQMRVLERIVLQLQEPGLHELIRQLKPEHSALIISYVGHVREAHRGEPVVPLSDRAFSRVLWLLTQAYLVRDPGSQFNRRSFVRSLLQGIAAREGLEYADVLTALRLGLEKTAARLSVQTSLPGVVDELARELGRPHPNPSQPSDTKGFLEAFRGDPELRTELVREMPTPLFESMLGRLCPAQAETLKALLRLFARIPAPYRPRPEELVRRALLDEAMLVHAGGELTEDSYVRVLRDLFPSPLPEVVERFLLREAAGGPAGSEAFAAAVRTAAARGTEQGGPGATEFIARHVADRRLRQRWAKSLPEAVLVRVVQRLAPRHHRELLDAAEVLGAAWEEAAPPEHPSLTGRRAFWSFMLDFLARNPGGNASVERLSAAFFDHVAKRYRASAAKRAAAGARLLESASRRARAGGRGGLVAALHHGRSRILAAWESPARRKTPEPPVAPATRDRRRSKSGKVGEAESSVEAEPLYVENAGLALAGPFLPHLLQTLDLLEEVDGKARVREGEAASRAVHLLQYLVDGRTSAPEPQLILNKIFCGLPLDAPVEREIELTERERETADALLRSLLANWKILSNTSVAGLQETFLQREGRLHRTPEGWKLQVQRKTVDVLVDEVPWSLSVIFHRWMPEALLVTW
jgi:Contractile injection system tape measure protein